MSAWWDDDHKLLLLTPAELAGLPDGQELTSIDDEVVVKGRDYIDDDTRFGHLAYGVTGTTRCDLPSLRRPAPPRPLAMGERTWTDYASTRPPVAGIYEWRIPSARVPGLVVRSISHFRLRGAGYSKVLSPEFDYWDGYKLHVPAGTEWREAPEGTTLKEYEQRFVCAEGADFDPCPFCGKQPTLKGVERSGNGVMISSDAHRFNTFWIECCAWAKSPHLNDPRQLHEKRREMLAKASPHV